MCGKGFGGWEMSWWVFWFKGIAFEGARIGDCISRFRGPIGGPISEEIL